MKPSVTIECCHKCYWLLRAAYIAQGLVTTFESELDSVALKRIDATGNFVISINGKKAFDRKEFGGFPEIKGLKQLVSTWLSQQKPTGIQIQKHIISLKMFLC